MNYVNKGPNLKIGRNVYDIAAVDAVTLEVLAYYIGYYNHKSKLFKLYPFKMTDAGKARGHRLEKRVITESQLQGFN